MNVNEIAHSPTIWAFLSATERRISRITKINIKATTAENDKTSKYANDDAC